MTAFTEMQREALRVAREAAVSPASAYGPADTIVVALRDAGLLRAEPVADDRLAEIHAREAAATKGPWRTEDDAKDLSRWVLSEDSTLTIGFGYVGNRTQDDAEFVAHAREDVPALLAEVDRLHQQCDTAARRDITSPLAVILKHGEMSESVRREINDLLGGAL